MPLLPLALFWGYGSLRMMMGFREHGAWAVRDAVQIIESLFLLVGFAFAASPKYRAIFFRWLVGVLCVATIYSLSAPFADDIGDWSPTILAANGREIPIIGWYATGYIVMTAFAVLLLLRHDQNYWIYGLALLILVAALTIF
jgi:hypothetical protein